MASRKQNEKRFKHWEASPDGGRRYWIDRPGVVSGFQRMVKIVDADEITMQIIQEIYDDNGQLVERHQKYPSDTGHEILIEKE